MSKRNLKKVLACTLCGIQVVVAIPMTNASTVTAQAKEVEYIDNSDVMPLYVPDEEVQLEKVVGADLSEQPASPDWLKTAIMAEVRLDTASTDGTLDGLIPMLEHYQEMGVNVLWVTPVHEMGEYLSNPNGYNNLGIHTIEPDLTGTTDYEAGWKKFADFVKEAHERNIRILLDIVPWGVAPASPLLETNPSLFASGDQSDIPDNVAEGQRYNYQWNRWGGYSYNWESEAFLEWFSSNILDIIETTDIDGIRADLDPSYAQYSFWDQVRAEALEMGHKIVVMSEQQNDRDDDYDLEQFGVMGYDEWTDPQGNSTWEDGGTQHTTWNYALQFHKPYVRDFFLEKNIVDCVKNGTYIGRKETQQYKDDSTAYKLTTDDVNPGTQKNSTDNSLWSFLSYRKLEQVDTGVHITYPKDGSNQEKYMTQTAGTAALDGAHMKLTFPAGNNNFLVVINSVNGTDTHKKGLKLEITKNSNQVQCYMDGVALGTVQTLEHPIDDSVTNEIIIRTSIKANGDLCIAINDNELTIEKAVWITSENMDANYSYFGTSRCQHAFSYTWNYFHGGKDICFEKHRFYTYNFSNHDHAYTRINNDLIRIGYQGIFAPFIPLWYMGEEMGADVRNQTLYYATDAFDLSLLEEPENRDFYEKLKKYIRIRRSYPDIFENFEANVRNNKICEVAVTGMEKYVAYARFNDNGQGIIVVPNGNVTNPNAKMSVTIPFEEMGMDVNQIFTVTNLMSDEKIASGSSAKVGTFDVQIPEGELGVYLVSYAYADKVIYTDEMADAVALYNSNTAPTKEGYVFGGWFADEKGETQVTTETVAEGTPLYAKFVPAYVLSVKAQNHKDVNSTGNMRLVSGVDDNAHYKEIGFDIYFGNQDAEGYKQTASGTKVYKKIIVNESDNTQSVSVPQDVFGSQANYFNIAVIKGIPKNSFVSIIYAKPYWVTNDGTKVYGLGKYVRVNDGLEKILNIPINICTAKKIAAGLMEIHYPENLQYMGYTASSRLFGEMEVRNDETNHMLRCAGNIATAKNGDIAANTDLYVSLQFKVAEGETVTVGKDRLYFAVTDATQFCNLKEELFDLSNDVWHVQY